MGFQSMWDNHKIQAAKDETDRINKDYLEVVPQKRVVRPKALFKGDYVLADPKTVK